jgi:hypothetical protein
MIAGRSSRAGQAGLLRGCCFGPILLLILLIVSVIVAQRALAAPNLGAAPGGPTHGSDEAVIAAALAGDIATQLVAREHAVATLSERDLTVIAAARNPSPDRYRNPQVRIRNRLIVVSANTSVGPFGVTAVATFELLFTDSSGSKQITAQAVDYAVGQLGVPGFIGDRLDPRGSATLNLTSLFAANPALELLSQSMDCVAVQADGVHVGFHRPGATPAPAICG